MPKPFTPKVLTANHLLEGDVIYMAPDGTWTRWLDEAEVLTDEAHAQVRLNEGVAQSSIAVGVYLADVRVAHSQPETTHFRETFRTLGPSNYPHGKQEVKAHV